MKLTFDSTNRRYSKMKKGVTDQLPGKRWRSSIGITEKEALREWSQFIKEQAGKLSGSIQDTQTELQELEAKRATIAPTARKSATLADLVNQWLEFKSAKVSPGQLVVYRSHAKFLLEQFDSPDLTIEVWEKMYNELLKRAKGKSPVKWSHKYCHDVLVTIKGFFGWASKRLTVPNWINSKEYSIEIPAKKVETFSRDEIKVLIDNASAQMQAWIWLALNCSMTQKDIAKLTWDQIDLKQGTLTRIRSKHEHRAKQPEVKYQLWPELLAYFQRQPVKKGKIFMRPNGQPLVAEKRLDDIAREFADLRAKVGQIKSFKHFRASGLTVVGSSVAYRPFREIYLCNSPGKVTDRNYDGTTDLPKEVTDHIHQVLIG